MKGFLRFVGIIEIIGYVVGIILLAINLAFVGVTIFYFILYLIFAPTIGILCLCVANLLESREQLEEKVLKLERKINSEEIKNAQLTKIIAKKTNDETIIETIESSTWPEDCRQQIMKAYMNAGKVKYFSTLLNDRKESALKELQNATSKEQGEKIVKDFKKFVYDFVNDR